MPRSKPRLAEEGRIRSDEEYEKWALSVVRETEDIRFTTDEEAWKQHYREKYPERLSFDYDLAENQLRGLWDRGMLRVWQRMPEVGVTPFVSHPRGIARVGFYGKMEKHFISYATVIEKLKLLLL